MSAWKHPPRKRRRNLLADGLSIMAVWLIVFGLIFIWHGLKGF